ncbi:helix-turn-helix transcriptional regulator [Allosphingosinicella flava]|uniref:Helix-turn-helix transcriptional regulator n=1 Tax=Allosphingosinicella flava TaxID=2771430 RepID=A0A7T2LLF5_9SPHN|nr:helix-turn-helix transcriptional regulator [Sphingosinicella flava]QPQ54384.1 helix-turn-helix transcriptional regulator [Sphingosinicella flava]
MARVSGKADYERQLLKLGQAIRAERKAQGLSQEALADEAGIDRSHMGKIERGERNVSLLNVIRIAEALQSRASHLLAAADL